MYLEPGSGGDRTAARVQAAINKALAERRIVGTVVLVAREGDSYDVDGSGVTLCE